MPAAESAFFTSTSTTYRIYKIIRMFVALIFQILTKWRVYLPIVTGARAGVQAGADSPFLSGADCFRDRAFHVHHTTLDSFDLRTE